MLTTKSAIAANSIESSVLNLMHIPPHSLILPLVRSYALDCEKGYFRFAEKQVNTGSARKLRTCKEELLQFLKKPPGELKITVMPDFFLDRIVNLECSIQEFFASAETITQRKGGSIDHVRQTDQRGGNAINVASAIAALGAKVTPIVCTNKLGLEQIRFHLQRYRIDFSHIKIRPDASITTALEFETENGLANLMLRDLGALEDIGPSDLTQDDYRLIEESNYVCFFNWAGVRKYGTQLAKTVFKRAKTDPKCRTFLDTADPAPNKEAIPKLMAEVLTKPNIDILSVNENEAVTYAAFLDPDIRNKQKNEIPFEKMAMEAARTLAKQLPARIDLHTTSFSASISKKKEVIVPAFRVKTVRATGAGDAWDAGNIMGDGNMLPDDSRLTLANAVSAYYLSCKEGTHPTREDLYQFVKKTAIGTL